MAMPITINFLCHGRNYIDVTGHLLNKIKEENKSKIHINFLVSPEHYVFEENPVPSISASVIKFYKKLNYEDKIRYAVESKSPYSICIDDDIIINNNIWDWIIENISLLDDSSIMCMMPLLTIGLPTSDFFIRDFLNEEEQKEIHSLFLKSDVLKGMSGISTEVTLEYLKADINQFTLKADKWNPTEFYNTVDKLQTDLLGAHPMRFSLEAQQYMWNKVLDRIDIFLGKNEYEPIKEYRPYFCNCCFAITTENWRKSIEAYGCDPWDEVPMNRYKRANNLDNIYIRRAFGAHTLYNDVRLLYPNGLVLEEEMYQKMKEKIIVH